MANETMMAGFTDLPPLPLYKVELLPPLLWPIPDKLLTLLLPIAAYWGLSMIFHWMDTFDFFPQYRLHTPAEVTKRNRVSRWEVVRSVIIQQIVQTAMGWGLGITEPDDVFGKEQYDMAVWAQRIRMAQRYLPRLLSVVGIDAMALGKSLTSNHPMFAGALLGGQYPTLHTLASTGNLVPEFAGWELSLAWAVYYLLIPAVQFMVAIIVVDTWQYFLHRAMHMNKWLYTTFHAHHHRLYVPYAYGALYNHPFEGFLLDTIGAAVAYKIAGLNTRQGMCLFTGSTLKTVDDHCGYALPFDPLQHLTSNNAGYHDVHHQSWGIKTNFSQPFFTFWDRLLGTAWTGGDVSSRYERSRVVAQQSLDFENEKPITGSNAEDSKAQAPQTYQDEKRNAKDLPHVPIVNQMPHPPNGKADLQASGSRQQILDDKNFGGSSVLIEEAQEENQARDLARRSPRKRSTSALSKDGLLGLKDRMTGTSHGRTAGIIGVDGSR